MKGIFKKTLSMILCFVMVFTMLQSTMIGASAKVVGPDNKTELTITTDKSKYSWGDTVVFNITVKNVTDEVLTGIKVNSFARAYIKVVQQGDLPVIARLAPGESETVQIEYYTTKLVGFVAIFFPIIWLFNPVARIAYREAHFNYESKVKVGLFRYKVGLKAQIRCFRILSFFGLRTIMIVLEMFFNINSQICLNTSTKTIPILHT